MDNNTHDLGIMKQLGLQTRIKPPPKVIECYWSLPPRGWLKVNTDGASKGNPGIAGWGAVLRKDDGALVGVSIGGLGVETCFIAETTAIIEGIIMAAEMGWQNIWVEADSEAAVAALRNNKPHWKLKQQWDYIKLMHLNLLITANKREANFAADTCARKGTHLQASQKLRWNTPPFQLPLENHNSVYYRFC
ncbi:hypothetical protein FRX31_020749 [Thalictrum thalictroides]|uniref:RNase H type-1 domain-containing protein n=1 Tax=Thalictrum thalictroides TaxID=46969 RepID=A0A7J6VXV1_THATH|nr:hypothetical protein FRX31_020749 [Thalictrum thalictroides]